MLGHAAPQSKRRPRPVARRSHASSCEGKVNLIVMATDAAMKQGAHAGNLIKSIAGKVGGGGGGRPNMAQAGGKNPAGILEAIAEAKTALEAQLS